MLSAGEGDPIENKKTNSNSRASKGVRKLEKKEEGGDESRYQSNLRTHRFCTG